MNHHIKRYICFFLLGLLSACYTNEKNVGNLLLTDDVCRPPCWQGITPAYTSRYEALDILNLPVDSEERVISWPSEYHIKHLDNSHPTHNTIEFDETGVVELLSWWSADGLTFEAVVNEFGEPSYIVYGVLNPGDAPWQRLGLLYPEEGLLFMTDFLYEWSVEPALNLDMLPNPNMLVVERVYFAPRSIEAFNQWLLPGGKRALIGIEGRIEGDGFMQPWKGWK